MQRKHVCSELLAWHVMMCPELVLWSQGVMIIVYTLRYLPIPETPPRGRRDLRAG